MPSIKPFLDHPDLIVNLEAAGVDTGEREVAEKILRRYGYHRLSGYRYLFREMLPRELQDHEVRKYRAKTHLSGTRLKDIAALADFDHRLRLCIVSGTEDFEVRLRTAIAHQIAQKDELGHLKVGQLDRRNCTKKPQNSQRTSHSIFLETVRDVTVRALQENDDFAIHHSQTYGPDLPVWAVVEHLTFGSLIHLYTYLKADDKRHIALKFGVKHPKYFETFIRAMANLRNKASHGVRLFNKPLKYSLIITDNSVSSRYLDPTRTFLNENHSLSRRIYAHAAVLQYLLSSHESGTGWGLNFVRVIEAMPTVILGTEETPTITPIRNMGFPIGWKDDPLWTRTPDGQREGKDSKTPVA